MFADDTEENLLPAYQMGMAVFHALDEQVTVAVLRELLELPGPARIVLRAVTAGWPPGTRALRARPRAVRAWRAGP